MDSKDSATSSRPPPEPIAPPLVKICGVTNLADAQAASTAGANFLGFNFINRSKRFLTAADLLSWWGSLETDAQRVALFQDASAADVEAVLDQLNFDVLQFHGSETQEFCAQFGLPFWKSVGLPVGGGVVGDSFAEVTAAFPDAAALVLDAVTVDAAGNTISGGTGKQFDWALWPRWAERPLILAGGLDASNVAAAIQATSPWVVDVSSGVESAPGRKDHDKMAAFCAAARRC